MSDFNKVVRIGTAKTYRGRSYSIFCKIEYKGGRLSITGVEGPTRGGNCLGGAGQIDIHLRKHQDEITLAPGWTRAKLAAFFEAWQAWHLNDMKAGTPAQEALLHEIDPLLKLQPGYGLNAYNWQRYALALNGLLIDYDYLRDGTFIDVAHYGANKAMIGYSYGEAWLKRDVPVDVITFLRGLPETDKQPAWV